MLWFGTIWDYLSARTKIFEMSYEFFKETRYVRAEIKNDRFGLYLYGDNPEHNSDNAPGKEARYLSNAKPISIICKGRWPLNDSNLEKVIGLLEEDIEEIRDAWMVNDYRTLYYPEGGFRTLSDYCIKVSETPEIHKRYITRLKALLEYLKGVTFEDRICFIKKRLQAYSTQNKVNSKEEFLTENREALKKFLSRVATYTPNTYVGIIASVRERISPDSYAIVNLTDKESECIALNAVKYSHGNRLPDPNRFRAAYRKWAEA